jgi:hypothetical protein
MEGDEKSEAIIGTWKILAAGSGLNAMLGGTRILEGCGGHQHPNGPGNCTENPA